MLIASLLMIGQDPLLFHRTFAFGERNMVEKQAGMLTDDVA
jgi:hypothetical protein